jgi:uncharacterized membrane protein YedE/YeeE
MSLPRVQLRLIAGGVSGVVFGMGLATAQMTNPNKVLNFLDLTGSWDASLLLVLGAATGLFAIAYHLIDSAKAPLLDSKFHFPEPKVIDGKLLGGSVLFGVGWGIAGYCPGPAIASLGFENPEALWFVPAMLAGIALQRRFGSAIFRKRGAT